jgi:ferric-dicitrate binding protein FerR (iron transport regulator)
MAPEEEHALEPEAVGGLLRLAGRRVPPPEERARRVQAAVHARWRRTVRARRLRRAALWTGLAAAAAGVAWVALEPPQALDHAAAGGTALPRAALAKAEKLSGQVRAVAGPASDPRVLTAGAELAAGTTLDSGGAGRAALRLLGGGSLRIDVGTRVRLTSASELLLEQGAVYVDSGHGRDAVTVHTRFGRVREQGTQFEVRVGAGALRVRVREGHIGLDHAAGADEAAPGEELRLEAGRLSRGRVALHGREWSWVEQMAPAFAIEGESLGRFAAWVSRETGRPVRLSAGDASIRLHGSIEGLTPQEALSAVLPACGRTHWYARDTIVVGRRTP